MVELEDLPNVGEKTAEKLRDAGFADMMRLATATAKELAVKAEKIDFETAFDVMEDWEIGRFEDLEIGRLIS